MVQSKIGVSKKNTRSMKLWKRSMGKKLQRNKMIAPTVDIETPRNCLTLAACQTSSKGRWGNRTPSANPVSVAKACSSSGTEVERQMLNFSEEDRKIWKTLKISKQNDWHTINLSSNMFIQRDLFLWTSFKVPKSKTLQGNCMSISRKLFVFWGPWVWRVGMVKATVPGFHDFCWRQRTESPARTDLWCHVGLVHSPPGTTHQCSRWNHTLNA